MGRTTDLKRNLILIVLLVTSFQLLACKPKVDPQANVAPPVDPYAHRDVEHRVSFSGETLGIIAAWYTGKATNWLAIKNANPGLKPERINLGQTIIIPGDLVTERSPLTKKFVSDAIAKLSKLKSSQPLPAKDEQGQGVDSGITGGVGYGSADTGAGASVADPNANVGVNPGSGSAGNGVAGGTAPGSEDVGSLPAVGDSVPPSTGNQTPPPADTERDKLLDELLSQ